MIIIDYDEWVHLVYRPGIVIQFVPGVPQAIIRQIQNFMVGGMGSS